MLEVAGTGPAEKKGDPVKADGTSCTATLDGKKLAGGCSWHLPKNASGKTLRIAVTATYQGVSRTRVYTAKVGAH